MSEERRETPAERRKVTLFVGKEPGDTSFGRTRDVSRTGLFLETEHRPGVDEVHTIFLVWGEDVVQSEARVVRHAPDGIGMSFIEPDAAFCYTLGQIIDDGHLDIWSPSDDWFT